MMFRVLMFAAIMLVADVSFANGGHCGRSCGGFANVQSFNGGGHCGGGANVQVFSGGGGRSRTSVRVRVRSR